VKKCITIAKFGVIPLVDDGQPVWLHHKIEEKTHKVQSENLKTFFLKCKS
jgi:hypothetical protein